MFKMVIFYVICLFFRSVFAADPCSSYALLTEARRSENYAPRVGYELLLCDRFNIDPAQWIRFKDTEMSARCVRTYHCGTHIPLWMNGAFPSQAEGVVSRQVCGSDPFDSDCCSYKETIQIKNCGGFFVYQLQPTKGCDIAYCAGTDIPCPLGKVKVNGICQDLYPLMTQNPTLSPPIIKNDTFVFNCHINFDPRRADVGFEVVWLFDNHPDSKPPIAPTTQLLGTQRDVELDQKYLAGDLQKTVSCKVRSFFRNHTTSKSSFIPSNGYWSGIKFDPLNLTVCGSEQSRKVSVISTIPIVCNRIAQQTCSLDLDLLFRDSAGSLKVTQSCSQKLRPSDWDPTKHEARTSFELLAPGNGKNNGNQMTVLKFDNYTFGNAPIAFYNLTTPELPIHICDKDTSLCKCANDPYCYTSDRQQSGDWYSMPLVGEFTLYKSTLNGRNFQVEIRTTTCGRSGTGSCICAVGAKEDKDVITIDVCHANNGITFPHVEDKTGPWTNYDVDPNGHQYRVDFPSGTQLKVNVDHDTLEVYVLSPALDYRHTEGLCGTFDKNPANDFKMSNGRIEPNATIAFLESWRIPTGQSIFDNINTFKPDPNFAAKEQYCVCDKNKQIDCTYRQASAPKLPCPGCNNGKPPNGSNNNGRKKRAGSNLEDDDALVPYFFDYGFGYQPNTGYFPTPSGTTRARAEQACQAGFRSHSAIQQCVSNIGFDYSSYSSMCTEDISLSDNIEYSVGAALSTAETSCSYNTLKNISNYDSHGNPPAFITTNLCYNECSKHGICVQGSCHCDFGYYGMACDIDLRQPPYVSYYISAVADNSPLCDATMRLCETAFVAGNNFFNNTRLSCKIEELQFDGKTFTPTGKHVTNGVVYKSMYQVGCKLPTKASARGHTVIGYNISFSNDGVMYSTEVQFFRIDSSCMTCDDMGLSCQIKDQTCLIDGNCRRSGDVHPSNQKLVCDSDKNKKNWTNIAQTQPGELITATQPTAPLGGSMIERFDIWTIFDNMCPCVHNPSRHDCACCDFGGCQCSAPYDNQCANCDTMSLCGTPQPAPLMGVDGYTFAFTGAQCSFDTSRYDCAQCHDQINACQCGAQYRNQCVDCNHMDQCGQKQWIFGPALPISAHNIL